MLYMINWDSKKRTINLIGSGLTEWHSRDETNRPNFSGQSLPFKSKGDEIKFAPLRAVPNQWHSWNILIIVLSHFWPLAENALERILFFLLNTTLLVLPDLNLFNWEAPIKKLGFSKNFSRDSWSCILLRTPFLFPRRNYIRKVGKSLYLMPCNY